MIITTTDSIADRKIKKYLGIVSGTDIYLVVGMLGGAANQETLYSVALKEAIDKMVKKADKLGADAIIGVTVNYTSPGGLNSMILAVTGTAVLTDEAVEYDLSNAEIPAL